MHYFAGLSTLRYAYATAPFSFAGQVLIDIQRKVHVVVRIKNHRVFGTVLFYFISIF